VALTGRLTLIAAILLAVVMPAVALASWNRVGGSSSRRAGYLRWAWRGTLTIGTQLSAVVLVAVLINDANKFYTSWLELLGEHHAVRNPVALPGSQDAALQAKLASARSQGRGIVVRTEIPGIHSGIGNFAGLVYLPVQYGLPEYAHRTFPVLELIAGSPGTPETWTGPLNVARILDREIAAGRSEPFIAVMPSQDVAGGRDTQCVNVVGGPQVDTYLTDDVRATITHAYRASTQGSAWGLMGYSSGGFCAANLAMRHPDMFTAAVSIAGNARPAHDHQTGELFGHDAALRDQNTPVWRATNLPPPDIALFLMASAKDTDTDRDATALAAAARYPMSVTRLSLRRGGHNFEVWRAEEPIAFAWISTHLVPPLAPPPVIDKTHPIVVNSTPYPPVRPTDHPPR
jgi:S-formylglutathione hydrolase FrmB